MHEEPHGCCMPSKPDENRLPQGMKSLRVGALERLLLRLLVRLLHHPHLVVAPRQAEGRVVAAAEARARRSGVGENWGGGVSNA